MRPIEILLVEDNPGDARLTREAFSQGTVRTNMHHARDGEQAIAFLRRQGGYQDAPTPDLVILDLNLPRRGGREVLEDIKTDPALRHIPVDRPHVLAGPGGRSPQLPPARQLLHHETRGPRDADPRRPQHRGVLVQAGQTAVVDLRLGA